MTNIGLVLVVTAGLFTGSLATCPWWEVLPFARHAWGSTSAPPLETCNTFFQQVMSLFGDLHRYDPNRMSPPLSPEHLAGFFKDNWDTICDAIPDSAKECADSVIENYGCSDDDLIFDYDAFPENFIEEVNVPLPARPILRNVTVADAWRYVDIAAKMVDEMCADPQPWIRSARGWTQTIECVKNTFVPVKPEPTTTTFNYNFTDYNYYPYHYERPIMPFALAQLTYETARLGTVKWFNGGQPLSRLSCDTLADATRAVLTIPTDPSCGSLLNTFEVAFDTLKDELCKEQEDDRGNEASNKGKAKTARLRLDMLIDLYSGKVKYAKLAPKRKPLRRRRPS